MKSVYLAGPTVFLPDAERVFGIMKDILKDHGLKGVAPVDNQSHLMGVRPGRDLNEAIYHADVGIMNSVDGAIFDISPFRRGTEMDAGTAFEIGYCRCRGIPMTGWTTQTLFYPDQVSHYVNERFGRGLMDDGENAPGAKSGSARDPDGVLVHSSGLYQNLMVQMAIETSGGSVYADLSWETAFAKAAAQLAKLLQNKPTALEPSAEGSARQVTPKTSARHREKGGCSSVESAL
jgi:nucleoside 2-deoxyribosyltransferase